MYYGKSLAGQEQQRWRAKSSGRLQRGCSRCFGSGHSWKVQPLVQKPGELMNGWIKPVIYLQLIICSSGTSKQALETYHRLCVTYSLWGGKYKNSKIQSRAGRLLTYSTVQHMKISYFESLPLTWALDTVHHTLDSGPCALSVKTKSTWKVLIKLGALALEKESFLIEVLSSLVSVLV